jgi:hypothetical protein
MYQHHTKNLLKSYLRSTNGNDAWKMKKVTHWPSTVSISQLHYIST